MTLGTPSVFQQIKQPQYGGGGLDSSSAFGGGLTAPGVPVTTRNPSMSFASGVGSSYGGGGFGPIAQWNSQQATPIGLPFDPTRGQPLGGMGDTSSLGLGQGNAMSTLLQQIWDMNARRAQEASANLGGSAGASAALANQRLDLQGQQLDVQRGALDRQSPLIDQLQASREGQHQSDMTYYGTMQKQAQTDYDQAMKHLDEELASLNLSTASDTRKQQSAATAMGSVVSQGNRDALTDIQNANVAGQQAIANERQGAASNRTQAIGLYTKRYNDAAYASKMDQAQSAEDKSKIYDQMKILDLQAQELGVSRAEVAQSLGNALKASKSQYNDVDQLLGALTSGDPNQIGAAYDWFKKQYPNGMTT